MTFDEAVAHVRAAASEAAAAYAFIPTVRRGATAGGAIYAVVFDAGALAGEDPVLVEYMDGAFGTGDGAVDAFALDEVPDEALDLDYAPAATYDPAVVDYDTAVALAVLRGATLDAALADADAARPAGPNDTPEARTADLLLARGFPAAVTLGGAALPAAVVLLDGDDRRLGELVDAFGGVVIDDVAPAPDGFDPPLPDDAPPIDFSPDADSPDESPPDESSPDEYQPHEYLPDEDAVGEAAWVGVGRGAVLAARLAAAALPEWGDDELPPDLAEAWRTLVAYADTAAASPPDPAGRRPKSAYQALRRLSAKVDRLVARQIHDHAGLMRLVAGVLDDELALGTFTADDLTLPSGGRLDVPLPLPGPGPADAAPTAPP